MVPKLGGEADGFWRWSARKLGARQLTDFGSGEGSAGLYWAVEGASVPALSRFCTATLLQLIQIDIQLAEEIVG